MRKSFIISAITIIALGACSAHKEKFEIPLAAEDKKTEKTKSRPEEGKAVNPTDSAALPLVTRR
ncbi:hypothetical protein E1176_16225 [Fulvivirga sp. RKSG066]|uniref:hypothetical protein n=1 Tax=Fulvivirga aurantia TaxID=2529383 RepID=UPI0012BBE1D6|nr:hypothetical protein [Fulvivirga aurantia]MTI22580.1 hypothetical protein [Fulvivirga aurantia]